MTTRSYNTPIRDRKAAQTRESILRALAEVVEEEGVAEMSVSKVAERAGVSHATIYRHFPNRRKLLDALGAWVRTRLQSPLIEDEVVDVDDLIAAVPRVFQGLDELGPMAEAMARISVAEDEQSSLHEERTKRFRAILEPGLAGFEDPEAVFAVLRHLLSAVAWSAIRNESELDGTRIGNGAVTVIQAVLDQCAEVARPDD